MGPARRSEGASPLSAAELERVLHEHRLRPREGGGPRVVTARVLHVATDGGEVAIKVFPAAQRLEARTEAALLVHLHGHGAGGYRVQHPLRTPSGEALLELDGRRVLVTRWERGEHRPYRAIEAAGWAELGSTLAALHGRLDEAPAPMLPLRRFGAELGARDLDDDRRTLEDHRRRADASDRPGAAVLRRLLADRLALLERHAAPCLAGLPAPADERPIHNDYNVHNYLFHDDGPPTILDWERAIHAPRELEVQRCLAHLPLVAPASAWGLVEGYLGRRALDPDRVGWAMHACATLHALKHWPVEPCLRGEPGAAERVAGMAEIVRSFVEGGPALAAFTEALRTRIGEHRAHGRAPHPRRS